MRRRERLSHARRLALCRLRVQDGLLRLVAVERLESHIRTGDPAFRANADRLAELTRELKARIAHVREGGGERAMDRHRAQGKLPVRDRIDRLLDPGSPWLELSPLAAFGMYEDEAPGAGIVTV